MKSSLNAAVSQITKIYGAGSIKTVDSIPEDKESVVSTGIFSLDKAIGCGGIRKGSIVEIFGPESAGKTTLSLHLAKQYQITGKPVLYIDSERTLTKDTIRRFGIDESSFYLLDVDNLEDALESCLIAADSFGTIIIDSIAGLPVKVQRDGSVGDSNISVKSKIISDTLPVIVPILSKSGCTLIVVNQIRDKVGIMFGNPETTTGGRALKHFATLRLDIRRMETLKENGSIIGVRTTVKVVKNKVSTPYKNSEFDIIFKSGISVEGDLLDYASDSGVVNKNGASYYFENKLIGRGRSETVSHLREDPDLLKRIKQKIYS